MYAVYAARGFIFILPRPPPLFNNCFEVGAFVRPLGRACQQEALPVALTTNRAKSQAWT